jgi:hypothetical protein
LNVAYLYYDYYSEVEFQFRKNFSAEEDESLLILFKKNPRIIPAPALSLLNHVLSLSEVSLLSPGGMIHIHPNNLVLRC